MKNRVRGRLVLVVLLFFGLLSSTRIVWADDPPKDEPPTEPPAGDQQAAPEASPPTAEPAPHTPLTMAELQKLVEEQRKQIADLVATIQKQREEMSQQKGDLSDQEKRIADLEQQLLSLLRRLDELQDELSSTQTQTTQALEERLKRVEQSSERTPELPPDVVSAGDFPGSIRIPGTDAAVKFGGRIRTAAVFTLAPLGSSNSFITNSIPVDEPTPPGEGKRTDFNANTSRFSFELRTPTGVGQMRAYIDGDFTGPNNSFRLRNAYAQFRGFLFGQTWSTFGDPKNDPEDLDFEGINAAVNVRQPLIRYRWFFKKGPRVEAAAENPEVSLTGGDALDTLPDLVARATWDFLETGHIQIAAVYRDIRGTSTVLPDELEQTHGYGASLSGDIPIRYWGLADRFVFQFNIGKGIGHYINDLNSLGGEDGVFNPTTNQLDPLYAYAWYVDYEHMWKQFGFGKAMNLRSSLIWGYVTVDNLDFQPDDAYYKTNRFTVNIVFSPIPRIDMGVEYLTGTRENKNHDKGRSDQIQFVGIFRF